MPDRVRHVLCILTLFSVLQNIQLLETLATDQQEQWSIMQATLAELQGNQPSLDQRVQEASQVRAMQTNVIHTSRRLCLVPKLQQCLSIAPTSIVIAHMCML